MPSPEFSADSTHSTWPEAMATVTACKYEAGAGRALAFGLTTSKHFRITFNYWAGDELQEAELHTGELRSEKAMPQGTLFPIRYDPTTPQQHEHVSATTTPTSPRKGVLIVGIIGSGILSLAWLILLRSCR